MHQQMKVVMLCTKQLALIAVSVGVTWQTSDAGKPRCFRYDITSNAEVRDAAIDPARAHVIEDRLLELGSVFGIEEFLSGWFKGAPFEAIHRGNVEDFIAYGFYCKRTEQLTEGVRACFRLFWAWCCCCRSW